MRIAFVSANREKMPDAVIPLGVLSVMAATPARHERTLIDLCFEDDPHLALHRALRAFEPDLVAVGLRNIQSNDYSGVADNLAYSRALVGAIRGATSAPIVLGGGGYSVMPRQILLELEADLGIAGEGELPFPQLLDALEAAAPLDRIPSFYRRAGEDVIAPTAAPVFAELDALPMVDRRAVDPRYYARYGIDSVQTKRGCPLRCDYCTYPSIEGRSTRRKSPERVARELERLRTEHPSVAHYFIVDSTFNLPNAHARAVCDAILERRIDLPWTCYANPIAFDAPLAERMAEAGCVGMEIGSDSGCDEILDRLQKGFHTTQIRRIHDVARAAGLEDCHTFVLGTQGETLDHVKRTLDFVSELDPFAAILLPWVDDGESVAPAYRAERRELRARVLELLAERARTEPTWIIPPLGVSFDEDLFDTLRAHGFRGPLWQHIRPSNHRRSRPRVAAPSTR